MIDSSKTQADYTSLSAINNTSLLYSLDHLDKEDIFEGIKSDQARLNKLIEADFFKINA